MALNTELEPFVGCVPFDGYAIPNPPAPPAPTVTV
jgi:hypothetical protein